MRQKAKREHTGYFSLDFDLLPQFIGAKILKGLIPENRRALESLDMPETLGRLRAASHFFSEVSTSKETWLNRANLRAGLNEFQKIEHGLKSDLGQHQMYTPSQSKNPLIHLVFRLRNVAVYTSSANFRQKPSTVDVYFTGERESIDIDVVLIDGIEDYLRKKRLSSYRSHEITLLCNWFEIQQQRWGAPQVLETAVMLYCEELCDYYSHRDRGTQGDK